MFLLKIADKGTFLHWHYCLEAAKFLLKTLDNLKKFAEIMDVPNERHIIHLCYLAGHEKH